MPPLLTILNNLYSYILNVMEKSNLEKNRNELSFKTQVKTFQIKTCDLRIKTKALVLLQKGESLLLIIRTAETSFTDRITPMGVNRGNYNIIIYFHITNA